MTMKCIIPGANVKVFGRAIHSLSKIGDELYVEFLENGLSLRTVNMARSAYACFNFAPTFFMAYDVKQLNSGGTDESDVLKCKINMKSCVSVFKSLSGLEKTVEKCKMSMQPDDARLIFQLHCHHGIVKTHQLLFIECDTLQAVFAKTNCRNIMTAQTRLFSDAVVNFQTSQEEVSLIAAADKLTIKNYIDNEPDAKQAIRTELSLAADEFDSYAVGVNTEVTFCLKELRAALSFSEAANLPLSLHFETAGKPIIFSIDGDATFEANFVLATLAVDLLPSSQSQSTSSQQMTPSISRVTQHRQQQPQRSSNAVRLRKPKSAATASSAASAAIVTVGNGSKLEDRQRLQTTTDIEPNNDEEVDSFDISKFNDTTIGNQTVIHDPLAAAAVVQGSAGSVTDKQSPVNVATSVTSNVTVPMTSGAKSRLFDLVNVGSPEKQNDSPHHDGKDLEGSSNDDDVDVNVVPGTPPSKKFKSMFFGLSQSTTSGSQTCHPPPIVLAEDSEED